MSTFILLTIGQHFNEVAKIKMKFTYFTDDFVIIKGTGAEITIVRALTSFHFNVFLSKFDKFIQCLLPSVTKKVISYSLVLEQQPLIALEIKKFIKVFQYILKLIETFLIQNYFYSNAKKY